MLTFADALSTCMKQYLNNSILYSYSMVKISWTDKIPNAKVFNRLGGVEKSAVKYNTKKKEMDLG